MSFHLISNKIKTNDDIFHMRMKHRMRVLIDSTDIIIVDHWGILRDDTKFIKLVVDQVEFYDDNDN